MLFRICVLRSTVRLSDQVSVHLIASAQALFAARARKIDLERSDALAGQVTTEWSVGSLGTFSGPIFQATLEIGGKTGKVGFIVPVRWLAADIDPDSLRFFTDDL